MSPGHTRQAGAGGLRIFHYEVSNGLLHRGDLPVSALNVFCIHREALSPGSPKIRKLRACVNGSSKVRATAVALLLTALWMLSKLCPHQPLEAGEVAQDSIFWAKGLYHHGGE